MASTVDQRPTGELKFEYIQGATAVTTAYARYPIKFVSATRSSDAGCAWVYTLGYGGGAVCGDMVTIRCSVQENCTAALTTQGSTKVYKRGTKNHEPAGLESEKAQCASQSLLAHVFLAGLLAVIPGPVTCFKDASFKQHQKIMLERGSSLIFVDWMTSGRMSRGEGWVFFRLESRNEIMVQTPTSPGQAFAWKPLVLDSLVLEDMPGLTIRERMLGMNVVGLAIMLGPRVEGAVSAALENEAGKRARFPTGLEPTRGPQHQQRPPISMGISEASGHASGEKTLCSVSPIEGGMDGWCRGLVYRFAAETTEEARAMLHELLLPMKTALGGRAAYCRDGGTC